MENNSPQANYTQGIQPPIISPTTNSAPPTPPQQKDRTKVALLILSIVLSVVVLIESFVLAVFSSNYFGVFETEPYDGEVVNDHPDLYEDGDVEEE